MKMLYNTIDLKKGACFMNIQKADIPFFSLGSLHSGSCENMNHKKVLPWLSIVQAQRGSYDIALGDQSVQNTGEGGFFIAPSGIRQNITHHIDPTSGVMCARWLFIDAVFNQRVNLDFCYDFPAVPPEPYRTELNSIFDLLFSSENVLDRYICCYKILKVLTEMGKPKLKKPDETMLLAFEFIRKNYGKEIRVEDLAKYLNMSESNFYAVFKKHFGIPPISYINKFRISLAEEKLKKTDDTIAAIASSVGINDPIYFNKLFRKNYQTSPNEYRKRYRQ